MVTGNPEGKVVSKAKIVKGKYEAKLEFPEGLVVQSTKPSHGEVGILAGTTHFTITGVKNMVCYSTVFFIRYIGVCYFGFHCTCTHMEESMKMKESMKKMP